MKLFTQRNFFMQNDMRRIIKKLCLTEAYKLNPIVAQLFHSNCILSKNKEKNGDVNLATPKEHFIRRMTALEKLKKNGTKINFDKYENSHSIVSIIEKYSNLSKGERTSVLVNISGKVTNVREAGRKLNFVDIIENEHKLQLKLQYNHYQNKEQYLLLKDFIRNGDYVGAKGYVVRTQAGELSLQVTDLQILGLRLALLPTIENDVRFKLRYIDLLKNKDSKVKLVTRADIINSIKTFLKLRNFLEVKTPVLTDTPSGAIAAPFVSFSNNLQQNVYFRIAPELYHKMLIVGEIPRVFEIGPQFRNEGLDRTHNPTFTTCEFYAVHMDYNDLFKMTETMLSDLVYKLFGSYKLKYNPAADSSECYEINFEPPFEKIDIMTSLEEQLGMKLPDPSDIDSNESKQIFTDLCLKYEILLEDGTSVGKLIDKLCDKLIVSKLINPTFLINHPIVMSPLAKVHRSRPGLTERFELYVAQLELCNAYTELNDPCEQYGRFQSESASADGVPMDESFLHALRHGLPPTAGWGIGIDRLVMLLTNSQNIRQIIWFPTRRPVTIPFKIDTDNNRALPSHPEEQLESILSDEVNNKVEDKTDLQRNHEDYFSKRKEERKALEESGIDLYPHKFESSNSIAHIHENYSALQRGDVTSNLVSVSGRVISIEKKDGLNLYTIFSSEAQLQLEVNEERFRNRKKASEIINFISRGDHIGTRGYITKNHSGELSLQVSDLQILAPCMVSLPTMDDSSPLTYVDLMLNRNSRQRLYMITDIKDYFCKFLKCGGFLEVETPLFINAQDRPAALFKTYFEYFGTNMYVCASPQLYLIKSLVGGMDKVYEIRTQFRNVIADRASYPEFTTCQYFMKYSDYRDTMELSETILRNLVYKICGSHDIKYNPVENSDLCLDANFSPPFERVDFMSALETNLNTKLPDPATLGSNSAIEFFKNICNKHGIQFDTGIPVGKILAKLCDKFLVGGFTNPTFLINHPLVMCPWAKSSREIPGLAQQFKLYAAGLHIGSGYTVINDPREQEARYVDKSAIDNGIVADQEYLQALRFGLPSTAGMTVGVDRLAMLLGNCHNINQIILFGKR